MLRQIINNIRLFCANYGLSYQKWEFLNIISHWAYALIPSYRNNTILKDQSKQAKRLTDMQYQITMGNN